MDKQYKDLYPIISYYINKNIFLISYFVWVEPSDLVCASLDSNGFVCIDLNKYAMLQGACEFLKLRYLIKNCYIKREDLFVFY